MIRSLHLRQRADNFKNDVRSSRKKGSIGKWVYLGLICMLFLWIANMFVGPMLWLQAEGLVSADRIVVASPYESQVVKVHVNKGQSVAKGDLIAALHSPSVVETIARLTADNAETQARQSELIIEVKVAEMIQRVAAERADVAEAAVTRLQRISDPGLLTNTGWTSAMRERFEAYAEQATAEARVQAGQVQLDLLNQAQSEAQKALEDLRSRYNDGYVRAPADAIVGTSLAQEGIVLQVGNDVADLYTGEPYVLAYIKTGTLYEVKPGDMVVVANGFRETRGVVVEVQPMADQLPPEFQRTFQPKARAQVAKIVLQEPEVFPLQAKVSIHADIASPAMRWLSDQLSFAGEWIVGSGHVLTIWAKDTAAVVRNELAELTGDT